MAEKKVVRKKPKFLRKDWHKKIKLGRGVKKIRKWRAAKGRHNKIRLGMKGHAKRPKIGWGSQNAGRGSQVAGRRVLNVKDLATVKKSEGIVIGSVGIKKRKEIIAKANGMRILILNKYLGSKTSRCDGEQITGNGTTEAISIKDEEKKTVRHATNKLSEEIK